jgi:hypothetical protein
MVYQQVHETIREIIAIEPAVVEPAIVSISDEIAHDTSIYFCIYLQLNQCSVLRDVHKVLGNVSTSNQPLQGEETCVFDNQFHL